ncbi:MAG: hypothetical protein ACE5EM_12700 [Sphingomonadales bacterium]
MDEDQEKLLREKIAKIDDFARSGIGTIIIIIIGSILGVSIFLLF